MLRIWVLLISQRGLSARKSITLSVAIHDVSPRQCSYIKQHDLHLFAPS